MTSRARVGLWVGLYLALTMSACASVSVPQQPSISTTPNRSATTEASSATAPAPLTAHNPSVSTPSILTNDLRSKGQLTDNRLNEISGLAASNYRSDFLWALNDSGNPPQLFRLNTSAELIDVWNVDANNRDWEAMASVLIDGTSYLVIAETGDNLQIHNESLIHIVVEPDSSSNNAVPLTPVHSLRFQYEGGPRNVEAIAVSDSNILLLTKERLIAGKSVPSQLFSLPLTLQPSEQLLMAKNIGTLNLPPRGFQIGALTRLLKIDPLQPTDMSISADGRHAYVLNYVQVLHYENSAREPWPTVFIRPPRILHCHGLRQAEALTVNALGEVWLTSEKNNPPLMGFKAFSPSVPFN